MSHISAMPRQPRSGCYKHIMVNLSTKAPCSKNRNSVLVQFPPSLSLMVALYLSSTDNELLYRTGDGDVVKLNVDTKETTVIVPSQLFVSIILLRH